MGKSIFATRGACAFNKAFLRKVFLSGAFVAAFLPGLASAFPTYTVGKITNVTFGGNAIFIMTNGGLPDNCIGTPYGWLMIPVSDNTMKSFVMGLWLRGDVTQVSMTVYTSGRDSSGYCQIGQIDPVE